MSEPAAGPLQDYIDKWLAAQPEQRIGLIFVDGQRFPGHVALAALEQELLNAAYAIREPQVAMVKLNWWAEELGSAGDTGGRHPLTKLLFDDPRASTIPVELWQSPAIEAMVQLEQSTAADFQAQLAAVSIFHGALAQLETAWWYGPTASSERATRVAALAHLLSSLSRLEDEVERDRLPLPMSLLARFGLSRAQLRSASSARQQALQAQMQDLHASVREASTLAGPLSVFRALELRDLRRRVRHALETSDPLADLRQGRRTDGMGSVLQAWRTARQWRRSLA